MRREGRMEKDIVEIEMTQKESMSTRYEKAKDMLMDYYLRVKPIGLLLVPDIKTIGMLYVLLMIMVKRHTANTFIANLIGNHLTSFYNLLSKNDVANGLTTFTVVVCGVYFVYRILKIKTYSWLMIISLFAMCYLLIDDDWKWAKTIVWTDYKWLIMLIVGAILICCSKLFVVKIKNTPCYRKPNDDERGFSVTTESGSLEDTGWQKYAENIASKLLVTDTKKESFAVGVSGVWGSGKTTFLYALEHELKGNVYLVKFNPWNSDSAAQISGDFFRTLISSLTITSYQRRNITQYAKLLSEMKAFGANTKTITSILEDSLTPISDAKDKAEDVIGNMPLPVVVLIDDLDRLDGTELMAVLRLVRVTANFRNLIFVVAYDKEYVSQTLAKVDVVKGEEFLKKIFPLEVCLPAFESYVMANYLYNELRVCIKDENLLRELDFRVYHGTARHRISYYLPTFRDVKRFVNQFSLNINAFIRAGKISEIDVVDFFTLELLHYYDFAAYQQIQYKPLSLLDYGYGIHKKYAYSYRDIGRIKGVKSMEDQDVQRMRILDGFKDGVPDLLWVLFGSTAVKGDNHLRYPTNFSKYFSYRINKDVISLDEFKKLLEMNTKEEMITKVREYCKGDVSKRASLKHHLTSFHLDSSNEKKAFNVAFALLELAMYGGVDAGPSFKVMFERTRYKDVNVVAEALMNAIKSHIGKEDSWQIIQNILTALVRFDIIDSCDENGGHVEYESVLNWDQLKTLAEENFMSALGEKKIDIQEITNNKSRYHDFLSSATALVSIEYYGGKNDERYSRSLLVEKLIDIYSKTDNKAGLKQFFSNLIPNTGDYALEEDDIIYYRNRNIASVFGLTHKNQDFYTFVEKAFKDYLPEINRQLKLLKMDEIKVEKEEIKGEPANMDNSNEDEQ